MLLNGFPRDKDQSQAEKRFSGFTIVELLVAMMIGSILAISVVALFINQTRAMALNEDLVDLEQNLRIAMDFLHRDSRMAGANTKDVLPPFTIGVIDDVDVDRDGDVDAGDVINSEGGGAPDALQILFAEAPALKVLKFAGLSGNLWVCAPFPGLPGQEMTLTVKVVDNDKHLAGDPSDLILQTVLSKDPHQANCQGNLGYSCPGDECVKVNVHEVFSGTAGQQAKFDEGGLWASMQKLTYFLTADANNDGIANDPALMRAKSFETPAVVAFGVTDMQVVYILDDGSEFTEITETDPVALKDLHLSIQRVRLQISGETRNAHNRIGGTTGKRQRTMTTEVQVRNLAL